MPHNGCPKWPAPFGAHALDVHRVCPNGMARDRARFIDLVYLPPPGQVKTPPCWPKPSSRCRFLRRTGKQSHFDFLRLDRAPNPCTLRPSRRCARPRVRSEGHRTASQDSAYPRREGSPCRARVCRQGLSQHLLQLLRQDGPSIPARLRPSALLRRDGAVRRGPDRYCMLRLSPAGPLLRLHSTETHHRSHLGALLALSRHTVGRAWKGDSIHSPRQPARSSVTHLGLPLDGSAQRHCGLRSRLLLGHPPILQRNVLAT